MLDASIRNKYTAVIGLEVHAQLLTNSKMYSSDANEYGNMPNTNISVITLAHPGTLPKVNKKAVEYAVKMGIACGSTITRDNHFARKNYFYPDLPKGYQISQDKTPICVGGKIEIKLKDGQERSIGLTRIHMEEDAGKSIHMAEEVDTLIDLNRAGVPLIEIVSEPEIRTSDEAYAYLTEIRKLVRYLEICDGNMEEGSLRCDANISVMLNGAKEFGKKVEVKNMNSIRNVQRAIEHEIERQIIEIEKGNTIVSETRTFDATVGDTHSMRAKEDMNDYRYFPEPDLSPLIITEEYLNEVKAKMPPLPNELYKKFTKQYGLSEYDALVLTDTKEVALYYDELCSLTKNYKAASNWIMGPVKSYLNELTLSIEEFPVKPAQLADLIALIDANKVSFSVASQKIYPELTKGTTKSALEIAEDLNLIQVGDQDFIQQVVDEVLAANPAKVQEYKDGKKGLLGMFMGEVMKKSKGKADPKLASELLAKSLD
ncbi:Asp-tRNA(Asn)/Glu-tRNA(Gln) amidotransferase subunit GatB [Cytophagales bacterium LB-30]|uniref:Aspartyl/glutamyl-tRNA(Asn/Gln) amidotransferase subunit B n=1 Tax=Shiella aurantiaca TaxID=3058365 RepID=A0ABT8F1R7_9BACT|nr:Asp-tRNA(Asn)/Glu-tRNA(Gln) amidotransferase subunit GatB [Shiella aurantiaca]MDN4164397.1 Asp-tRNA(Asn)/Glu-tRNA(Gln) amidotransferase subunit GatB [Shiella aurantiaca]